MNYDFTISKNVSLSRVLDEMIAGGSDFDLIVQFLKSHESSIKDIYAHSALVYDLYDLGRHPYRVDPFLVKHIDDLRKIDFLFAVNSLATFSAATENKAILKELKGSFHGNTDVVSFLRAGWVGVSDEDKIYACETDLTSFLNKMAGTHDSVRFIAHSFLSLSAFQAFTFLNLNPATQFTLLKGFQEVFDEGILRVPGNRNKILNASICGDILGGLLRQLLVLNQTEIFNWVLDVLEFNGGHYFSPSYIRESVKGSIYRMIPESLSDKVMESDLQQENASDMMSFEEIVFEMNLLETMFEPYDLFLVIYLIRGRLLNGMKENKDLLEFFSLPFDWEDLNWMKDEPKADTQGFSMFDK